jgi:hypothetical protein
LISCVWNRKGLNQSWHKLKIKIKEVMISLLAVKFKPTLAKTTSRLKTRTMVKFNLSLRKLIRRKLIQSLSRLKLHRERKQRLKKTIRSRIKATELSNLSHKIKMN